MQPFRQSLTDLTYPEHLAQTGFNVRNASKESAIVSDLYRYLEDECIRHSPDFVIFNFGIVECTYRARPRWLQNFLSMNAWNNSIVNRGYNGPVTRGMKFLTKKVYRKAVERPLFSLGLKWRWLGPKDFRFIIRDIVKRLLSDTPVKRIIFIGLPPIAPWVEKQAPGTQQSIKTYNLLMENLTHENPNIHFLDPASLSSPEQMLSLTSDGIHFTALGHQRLAEALIPLLQGERSGGYTDWQKINQYESLYQLYARWYKR